MANLYHWHHFLHLLQFRLLLRREKPSWRHIRQELEKKALGKQFYELGEAVERVVMDLIMECLTADYSKNIELDNNRVLDFRLEGKGKRALMEVKYRIPLPGEFGFERAVSQLEGALMKDADDIVLWAFQDDPKRVKKFLQFLKGKGLRIDRIKVFVGPADLFSWVVSYFACP